MFHARAIAPRREVEGALPFCFCPVGLQTKQIIDFRVRLFRAVRRTRWENKRLQRDLNELGREVLYLLDKLRIGLPFIGVDRQAGTGGLRIKLTELRVMTAGRCEGDRLVFRRRRRGVESKI